MSGKDDLDLLFDLGVALPGPVLVETSPGHIESFPNRRSARRAIKKRVEDIAANNPKRNRDPGPPYRCVCRTKFDTFEQLLAHSHRPSPEKEAWYMAIAARAIYGRSKKNQPAPPKDRGESD